MLESAYYFYFVVFRYAPKGLPGFPTCNLTKGALLCRSSTAQNIRRFNSAFYKEHDKT